MLGIELALVVVVGLARQGLVMYPDWSDTMQPMQISVYLSLPTAEIKGVCQYIWLLSLFSQEM